MMMMMIKYQIPFDRFTDLQVNLCIFFSWDLIFLGDIHFLEKYIFWGNSFFRPNFLKI